MLGFPDPPELGLTRPTGLNVALARFENLRRARLGDPRHPLPARRGRRVLAGSRRGPPQAARRTRAPGRHPALQPPGRRVRPRRRRQEHGGGHPHGQRQDALLQPARAQPPDGRPRRPRHVPVPHQGPGRRPAPRDAAGPRRRGLRPARLHLRRRHAAGRAQGHTRARQHRPHQSRHAARRHSAAPHQVGQAVREPALLHHRRAALLPRSLRQPRGQRHPPPEAHLRVLRLEAAVHLLLRHHRQSARAGRSADGRAVRAGRAQRRAFGREVLHLLQPALREPRSSASAAATCRNRSASPWSSWRTACRRSSSPTTAWRPRCWSRI